MSNDLVLVCEIAPMEENGDDVLKVHGVYSSWTEANEAAREMRQRNWVSGKLVIVNAMEIK